MRDNAKVVVMGLWKSLNSVLIKASGPGAHLRALVQLLGSTCLFGIEKLPLLIFIYNLLDNLT